MPDKTVVGMRLRAYRKAKEYRETQPPPRSVYHQLRLVCMSLAREPREMK